MAIDRRTETGGLTGFWPVFGLELSWWLPGRWVTNTAIWLGLLNSFLMVLLAVSVRQIGGLMNIDVALGAVPLFVGAVNLLAPVGAVLVLHDRMLEDATSGAAGWLSTLPVGREAYALAKASAAAVAILGTAVVPTAAVAYAQLSWVAKETLPVTPYICAWGLLYLAMMAYALTAMAVGALTSSRSAALAVPLAVWLAGFGGRDAGKLASLFPWSASDAAASLILGDKPFNPAVAVACLSWAFIAVAAAVWASRRAEY